MGNSYVVESDNPGRKFQIINPQAYVQVFDPAFAPAFEVRDNRMKSNAQVICKFPEIGMLIFCLLYTSRCV